jgi:hypothetical protein
MRLAPSLGFAAALALFTIVLGACPAPKTPEATCSAKCEKELAPKCDEHACERGCLFVLDRLIENEGDAVLACVKTAGTCDDKAWAECAARIGVHADGGPAAPPPPPEE